MSLPTEEFAAELEARFDADPLLADDTPAPSNAVPDLSGDLPGDLPGDLAEDLADEDIPELIEFDVAITDGVVSALRIDVLQVAGDTALTEIGLSATDTFDLEVKFDTEYQIAAPTGEIVPADDLLAQLAGNRLL